jgi:hypothetical protein
MVPPLTRKNLENKTEEVMNDVRFPEPVTLEFSAASRNVASSLEALECLDQQWPERARGRKWRGAVRACRDALDGWRSARDAHKAFLEAARRAGLTSRGARLRHDSPSARQSPGSSTRPPSVNGYKAVDGAPFRRLDEAVVGDAH